MIVSLIVAMADDGLIGRGGSLPWHLPAELRRFRRLTMGKPIVMGRRTYESIGRPLDGRLNIVLSRRPGAAFSPGVRVAGSLAEGLEIARASGADEVMVLGGAAVFAESLPLADRIYLTRVAGSFSGDTYFPIAQLDASRWAVRDERHHPADAANPHAFRTQVLERRPS